MERQEFLKLRKEYQSYKEIASYLNEKIFPDIKKQRSRVVIILSKDSLSYSEKTEASRILKKFELAVFELQMIHQGRLQSHQNLNNYIDVLDNKHYRLFLNEHTKALSFLLNSISYLNRDIIDLKNKIRNETIKLSKVINFMVVILFESIHLSSENKDLHSWHVICFPPKNIIACQMRDEIEKQIVQLNILRKFSKKFNDEDDLNYQIDALIFKANELQVEFSKKKINLCLFKEMRTFKKECAEMFKRVSKLDFTIFNVKDQKGDSVLIA